jgi:hypothetical protein
LKGKIVSVTTDGFITDISDLEVKIMKNRYLTESIYMEYRKARGNSDIIELKSSSKGMMS